MSRSARVVWGVGRGTAREAQGAPETRCLCSVHVHASVAPLPPTQQHATVAHACAVAATVRALVTSPDAAPEARGTWGVLLLALVCNLPPGQGLVRLVR